MTRTRAVTPPAPSPRSGDRRTTIELESPLARGLRLAAADKGISESEVVATALEHWFVRAPPPGSATAT